MRLKCGICVSCSSEANVSSYYPCTAHSGVKFDLINQHICIEDSGHISAGTWPSPDRLVINLLKEVSQFRRRQHHSVLIVWNLTFNPPLSMSISTLLISLFSQFTAHTGELWTDRNVKLTGAKSTRPFTLFMKFPLSWTLSDKISRGDFKRLWAYDGSWDDWEKSYHWVYMLAVRCVIWYLKCRPCQIAEFF